MFAFNVSMKWDLTIPQGSKTVGEIIFIVRFLSLKEVGFDRLTMSKDAGELF